MQKAAADVTPVFHQHQEAAYENAKHFIVETAEMF